MDDDDDDDKVTARYKEVKRRLGMRTVTGLSDEQIARICCEEEDDRTVLEYQAVYQVDMWNERLAGELQHLQRRQDIKELIAEEKAEQYTMDKMLAFEIECEEAAIGAMKHIAPPHVEALAISEEEQRIQLERLWQHTTQTHLIHFVNRYHSLHDTDHWMDILLSPV